MKKGDLIAFIQDNVGSGELERVSYESGLERHEMYDNYLIVTESGIDIDLKVRIAYRWFDFKFKSLRDYSSDLNGEDLIYEDFLIRVENDIYLEVYGDINEFISQLGG